MDSYVTGAVVRRLRESKSLTQNELGDCIGVSAKAISKWETGRGLPDISLIEPLAQALGVSVVELMSGDTVTNRNRSANMLRSKLYICPVCNVIQAGGEAVISCCGLTLPAAEAEEPDEAHSLTLEPVEDEQFLTVRHPMTKTHYISFMAYVIGNRFEMVRLYPEGNAEARFRFRGHGKVYYYCNRHGLFVQKV